MPIGRAGAPLPTSPPSREPKHELQRAGLSTDGGRIAPDRARIARACHREQRAYTRTGEARRYSGPQQTCPSRGPRTGSAMRVFRVDGGIMPANLRHKHRGHRTTEKARIKKAPSLCSGLSIKSLAVTYSRTGRPRTTIGAEWFHFRVRNGFGWFPLAMAARQTGNNLCAIEHCAVAQKRLSVI